MDNEQLALNIFDWACSRCPLTYDYHMDTSYPPTYKIISDSALNCRRRFYPVIQNDCQWLL